MGGDDVDLMALLLQSDGCIDDQSLGTADAQIRMKEGHTHDGRIQLSSSRQFQLFNYLQRTGLVLILNFGCWKTFIKEFKESKQLLTDVSTIANCISSLFGVLPYPCPRIISFVLDHAVACDETNLWLQKIPIIARDRMANHL